MAAAPPPPGLQQPGPSPPAPEQKGQRSLRRRQGQRADELGFGISISGHSKMEIVSLQP